MSAIVDTSVWIEFFKGRELKAIDHLLEQGVVVMTPIILAELMSGVTSRKDQNQLHDFLSHLSCHDCDFEHWIAVGLLRKKCREKGFAVSTPDAHIAQCALEARAILYTKDKIFKKISKLLALQVEMI